MQPDEKRVPFVWRRHQGRVIMLLRSAEKEEPLCSRV